MRQWTARAAVLHGENEKQHAATEETGFQSLFSVAGISAVASLLVFHPWPPAAGSLQSSQSDPFETFTRLFLSFVGTLTVAAHCIQGKAKAHTTAREGLHEQASLSWSNFTSCPSLLPPNQWP